MDFRRYMSLSEGTVGASRYSVDVNFRSTRHDTLLSHAKIVLGYVSAHLKKFGLHVRLVFDEDPVRIIVASRNFDAGEWVIVASFNPQHEGGRFVVSKGWYNRDNNTVKVKSSKMSDGDSASAISDEIRNMLHQLKGVPDGHREQLKGVRLKTGPK